MGRFVQIEHVAAAVARLPAQFQGKPNMVALASIWGQRCNLLEQVIQDLDTALSSVAGALKFGSNPNPFLSFQNFWLERFGKLVGEPRNGRSDAAYAVRIAVRRAINRSSGTGDELLKIFQLLIPTGQYFELREEFPAAFTLVLRGPLPAGLSEADGLEILKEAKSAGVRVVFWDDALAWSSMLVLSDARGDLSQGTDPSTEVGGALTLDDASGWTGAPVLVGAGLLTSAVA